MSVVIVLVLSLLPNYRSGSYGVYFYAFPVQQSLVICGLGIMNLIVFAIVAAIATLPLAALSWILVEKPACL